ncbi:MAG TPA: hypothetical protein VE842_01290 [Pyrinomonadaceae bacterium]|nr:hypothetical protein [Pyrinomonadaceae bacterium]
MSFTYDRYDIHEVPLKEQGIYAFPDGTQVVACAVGEHGLVLYYLRDWKLYGAAEVLAERNAAAFRLLEANPAGSILMYGYPTRWTVKDLVDTGRVAV